MSLRGRVTSYVVNKAVDHAVRYAKRYASTFVPHFRRKRRRMPRGYGTRRRNWHPGMRKSYRPRGVPYIAGRHRTAGNYRRYTTKNLLFPGEKKYHDIASLQNPVPAVGDNFASTLNAIPQGDTERQRDGRMVHITSIHCRVEVRLPANVVVGDSSDICRLMLVMDKQCNGAIAPYLAVIDTTDYDGFRALENSHRFHVIWDKWFPMSAQGGNGTSTSEVVRFWRFNKSGLNIPIHWDPIVTTGVLASIRSNNLFLLGASESGLCVACVRTRIRFRDN